MGEYKRVADILGAISDREQIHGLVEPKHSPEAKYKQPGAKYQRPSLKVGSKLVWPIMRGWKFGGSVACYAMGIVLDWGHNGSSGEQDIGHWSNRHDVIVQVVRVSNPEFEWMVGHLRSITMSHWDQQSQMPLFVPEECAAKDYGL